MLQNWRSRSRDTRRGARRQPPLDDALTARAHSMLLAFAAAIFQKMRRSPRGALWRSPKVWAQRKDPGGLYEIPMMLRSWPERLHVEHTARSHDFVLRGHYLYFASPRVCRFREYAEHARGCVRKRVADLSIAQVAREKQRGDSIACAIHCEWQPGRPQKESTTSVRCEQLY